MESIDYTPFKAAFGAPRPGTAADLHALGLAGSAALHEFVSQVGGGMFQRGLFSVTSQREQIPSLCGWERGLPDGLRPFASSAFGVLLLTRGEDVWFVDTRNGEGFEADMTIQDALLTSCKEEIRQDFLQESLFRSWSRDVLELAPTHVLAMSPPPAWGGFPSRENLREVDMSIHLSVTAQMLGPLGPE